MVNIFTGRIGEKFAEGILVLDITAKNKSIYAPDWSWLMQFKRHEISWKRYTELYTEKMDRLYSVYPEAFDLLIKRACTTGIALVCYCTSPYQCHRRLLAEMLQKIARSRGHDTDVRIA